MDKIADVLIEIRAKTDKIEKDFNKIKKQSETSVKSIENNFKKVGGIIAGVFALDKVLSFFKSSIQGARDAARAFAQISQAVKQTGQVAGFTAKELKQIAENYEKTLAIDADSILQGVTLQLLTFTKITGQAFERAQKAVLDLAAVLGTDLKSQSIQLGKALEDPIKGISALSKAGVTFTDIQKENIKKLIEQNKLFKAQSIILDEIEAKYGGQAEVLANVDGKINKTILNWNSFKDIIGETALVIVDEVLPALNKLTNFLKDTSTESLSSSKAVRAFANAIGTIADFAVGTFSSLVVRAEEFGKILGAISTGSFSDIPKIIKDTNKELDKIRKDFDISVRLRLDKQSIETDLPKKTINELVKGAIDLGRTFRETDSPRAFNALNLTLSELKLRLADVKPEELANMIKKLRQESKGSSSELEILNILMKAHSDALKTNINLTTDYITNKKEVTKLIESSIDLENKLKTYNEALKDVNLNEIQRNKLLEERFLILQELERLNKGRPFEPKIELPNELPDDTDIQLKDFQVGSKFKGHTFFGEFNKIVDKLKQKQSTSLSFKDALNEMQTISSLSDNLSQNFEFAGKSFVQSLSQAINIVSSIIGIIGGIAKIVSGGSIFDLFGAHGGTFQNGRKIGPGFATGGSFVVPGGFPNDSFPLRVQSGERVTVQSSANTTNDFRNSNEIIGLLKALNKNLIDKKLVVNNNLNIDGKKLVKEVVKPVENRLRRTGLRLDTL